MLKQWKPLFSISIFKNTLFVQVLFICVTVLVTFDLYKICLTEELYISYE